MTSPRKQWLVDKITALSAIFAIELCAYSIMSNNYHLVLRVNKSQALEFITLWRER